jgi:hypothetical protein
VHIWKIIPDERFKDFADDLESKIPWQQNIIGLKREAFSCWEIILKAFGFFTLSLALASKSDASAIFLANSIWQGTSATPQMEAFAIAQGCSYSNEQRVWSVPCCLVQIGGDQSHFTAWN